MKLNTLQDSRIISRPVKCLGRGIGSGKGKTSGRGHKGQKARAGATVNGFEGGQMPIHRRLPKRGFTNFSRIEWQVVNVGQVQTYVDAKKLDAKHVTKEALLKCGLIKKERVPVKLLGFGELKSALQIEVCGASKSAIKAVEKAGGKVILPPAPAEKAA